MSQRTPGLPRGGQLLGLREGHVRAVDETLTLGPQLLHPAAATALAALRRDARQAGFDLRAVSAFRSFQRQALIWNGKARGERALLDGHEQPLDAGALEPVARMEAILRWSALPGCSRHHWGSDLDVVDAAALAPDGVPRLLASECAAGGRQAGLHRWLDTRILRDEAHGFFRPYTGRHCAVAAEPWHLSHAPVSSHCQARFDPHALRRALRAARIELLDEVESALAGLLPRYVILPSLLYPQQWRDVAEGRAGG